MHVIGAAYAGIRHGRAHRFGHLLRLRPAAHLLRLQRQCVRPPDGQRRSGRALAVHPLEHDPVRGHAALGSAGHDETDLIRRRTEMGAQQQRQGLDSEAARKIVHAAIAFGLAENGEDALRRQRAGGDGGGDAGHVVGSGGRNAVDPGNGHVSSTPVRNGGPWRHPEPAWRRPAPPCRAWRRASARAVRPAPRAGRCPSPRHRARWCGRRR